MPRFKKGKRGSIINKWGVKITKKEQEEINRLKKEIDKVRTQLQRKLTEDQEKRLKEKTDSMAVIKTKKGKKIKVKNKFQEDFENFHLEDPMLPNRRTTNKNQFKNKGLLEAWLKTARQIVKNPMKYLDQKKKQFQENYLQSILNNFSNGMNGEKAYEELPKNVKELYDKVLGMTPDEFYEHYLNGDIPDINENYIPADKYPKYIEDTYGYFEDHEEVQMKFDEYGNPLY